MERVDYDRITPMPELDCEQTIAQGKTYARRAEIQRTPPSGSRAWNAHPGHLSTRGGNDARCDAAACPRSPK